MIIFLIGNCHPDLVERMQTRHAAQLTQLIHDGLRSPHARRVTNMLFARTLTLIIIIVASGCYSLTLNSFREDVGTAPVGQLAGGYEMIASCLLDELQRHPVKSWWLTAPEYQYLPAPHGEQASIVALGAMLFSSARPPVAEIIVAQQSAGRVSIGVRQQGPLGASVVDWTIEAIGRCDTVLAEGGNRE